MNHSIDKPGELLVTCGFSGSGKSTLVRHVLNVYPGRLSYTNTLTTRSRRENEDEVEYTFVTQEDYDRAKSQATSWDESVIYDNYYGLDPGGYIDKMNRGENLIVCSVPSEEIIEDMGDIYGRGRIKTIHLSTQLSLAAERLNARNTPLEIGRLATDRALMDLDGSNGFQPDYIFESSGDLGKDKSRFANLIGDIING